MDMKRALILPSCEPDASISESLLKLSARTAVSCIMNCSSAWYCRSFFNLPLMKSHTCRHVGNITTPDLECADWCVCWGSPGAANHEKRQSRDDNLYEAVNGACDQHLAVQREASNLRMAFLAEFDGAVKRGGETLDLVSLALCLATEQIESCPWRQHTLLLLPAGQP